MGGRAENCGAIFLELCACLDPMDGPAHTKPPPPPAPPPTRDPASIVHFATERTPSQSVLPSLAPKEQNRDTPPPSGAVGGCVWTVCWAHQHSDCRRWTQIRWSTFCWPRTMAASIGRGSRKCLRSSEVTSRTSRWQGIGARPQAVAQPWTGRRRRRHRGRRGGGTGAGAQAARGTGAGAALRLCSSTELFFLLFTEDGP